MLVEVCPAPQHLTAKADYGETVRYRRAADREARSRIDIGQGVGAQRTDSPLLRGPAEVAAVQLESVSPLLPSVGRLESGVTGFVCPFSPLIPHKDGRQLQHGVASWHLVPPDRQANIRPVPEWPDVSTRGAPHPSTNATARVYRRNLRPGERPRVRPIGRPVFRSRQFWKAAESIAVEVTVILWTNAIVRFTMPVPN
jgi:hypothetical protein